MWFYKEARALAALDHPTIVHARDFGQLMDGSPFLAMDLATGVSLHDLSYTRLEFPIIWSVVDQILNALAHAHARGIIHGDLKPSNILVENVPGEPPLVHILDFGLAWLKQDPHDERLDGEKAMEFAPHAGAGTPGYMAPEQIQHEMHHVCGATDLYALGCILYKLLSGRAPFSGDSKELLREHAFTKPPELEPIIELPPGVVGFVTGLLAKKPWERWEFAAEARREWAAFRPTEVEPQHFALPRVRLSSSAPAPSTKKTGPRGQDYNPALRAVPQRAPGLLSIRPSPLVGRDDVRQTLRDTCDEVIDGEGAPHRLIILVGPAGSGKSRIAEWLCEVVHEEGSMVPLRARYRPIRGALDGMLGAAMQWLNFEHSDRNTIEKSLLERWKVKKNDKNGRAWVAGAAEWFRPLGAISDQPLGPTGIRFTLDTLETRRLVTRYTLRKVANGRPLLFWLDDLHHAGETTFEGLLRIFANEPDPRIVMVATVRAEDVHLGTPAAERLRQLREKMNGTVLDVRPLDPETTVTLLKKSLPLDDPAAHEAARRSRGNPLFALQQLHAWALAGNLEYRENAYRVPEHELAMRPKTTAELWDSRVGAMPEPHRLAAYAAATMSSDIRREVLHALLTALKLPADAAIVSLQKAEIIIPRDSGRYGWPHALLQEHLHEQLDAREDREQIYRAAADALGHHPLANTRRIVRQRVINLLHAEESDAAAQLLFDFVNNLWAGAREPLATLNDLELLRGKLQGRSLALKNRWQAEALRHVGRAAEALEQVEIARDAFEDLNDVENLAHCLRLLGHLKSELGNSAEGLSLVRQALESFAQAENELGQAQCQAVAGEIEYLLGNYEHARSYIKASAARFAGLDHPLGHGQCLLLLSWIDHSEGSTESAKRLTQEARVAFERTGYRLGAAQADTSLAHVEHRMHNYHLAAAGALEALSAFENLRTPRGQAACERLLSMIRLDTDDLAAARHHAERALSLYELIGDPWGLMEARLLLCQVALARHALDEATVVLEECAAIAVEEAEPRQHYLLTRCWLAHASGNEKLACESLRAASEVFSEHTRVGDHTPHLVGRLSRLFWSPASRGRVESWQALLSAPRAA
jgi:tetratricopeptide (TPR) repeat protein